MPSTGDILRDQAEDKYCISTSFDTNHGRLISKQEWRQKGVLEPLRRLWYKVTLQSRLVLELQTKDSQARIGKNRGSRLSKFKGSGHLLVQVFHQKKKIH